MSAQAALKKDDLDGNATKSPLLVERHAIDIGPRQPRRQTTPLGSLKSATTR